jgi:hypothetical protein
MEWVKNLLENPPDQTPEEGSENQDQGSGSGE